MSIAERLAKAERPDKIADVRARIQERAIDGRAGSVHVPADASRGHAPS